MAIRTTHSTESTQAKLYMYLAVPIKYYTLIWSSWAVELNNETVLVSLDSLLLQYLINNKWKKYRYLFFVGPKCNIIFQICALKQMWLHIMLAVWLILMAIISAFETNSTDFFLFSSFFCPSKTDICFNSQTLLTQTLRGPQKVSVITGVCNKQIKFRKTGRAREASNAGVFRGAFVWEGQNMSSPKNAWVGD